MQDFGTKSDDTAGPSGQLSAAEFNNLATELENAVLRSGLALNGASVIQLATSLFLHGAKSQTFQDSGAANAYVATPVSGAGGVLLPADYAAMNGAIVLIKASAANTTASTLNIGQTTGTLLGTKAIVYQDGTALTVGAIAAGTYIQLRYDSTIGAGSWVLLPASRPIASALQAQQQLLDNVLMTPQKLGSAFQGANQSLAANGFQKLPGGMIIQWGTATVSTGGTATFPTTFPAAADSIVVSHGPGALGVVSASVGATTTSNFVILHNGGGSLGFMFVAIGR